MENKKLFITDTILRDAHQSQAATRMRIEDMITALEKLDKLCDKKRVVNLQLFFLGDVFI